MRRTARDGTARREDGPDGEDGSGGAAAKTAEDDCPMPGIPEPQGCHSPVSEGGDWDGGDGVRTVRQMHP